MFTLEELQAIKVALDYLEWENGPPFPDGYESAKAKVEKAIVERERWSGVGKPGIIGPDGAKYEWSEESDDLVHWTEVLQGRGPSKRYLCGLRKVTTGGDGDKDEHSPADAEAAKPAISDAEVVRWLNEQAARLDGVGVVLKAATSSAERRDVANWLDSMARLSIYRGDDAAWREHSERMWAYYRRAAEMVRGELWTPQATNSDK